MSCPSMAILPSTTSTKRKTKLVIVDLPAPEWPTKPTRSPGFISRVNLLKTFLPLLYSKETSLNTTCPSCILSASGFLRSNMSGVILNISIISFISEADFINLVKELPKSHNISEIMTIYVSMSTIVPVDILPSSHNITVIYKMTL